MNEVKGDREKKQVDDRGYFVPIFGSAFIAAIIAIGLDMFFKLGEFGLLVGLFFGIAIYIFRKKEIPFLTKMET